MGGGSPWPKHANEVENALEHPQEAVINRVLMHTPADVSHVRRSLGRAKGVSDQTPPSNKINDLPCQHPQEVATAHNLC